MVKHKDTDSTIDEPDLREQLNTLQEDFRELGRQVAATVGIKASKVRDSTSDMYERGKDRVTEYGEGLLENIRKQPVRSVLIAAGIGALLGILSRRR